MKKCEEIFSSAKFNFPLFQHCLQKVSSEMRKESSISEAQKKKRLPSLMSSFIKGKSSTYFMLMIAGIAVFSVSIMFFMKYYQTSFPRKMR